MSGKWKLWGFFSFSFFVVALTELTIVAHREDIEALFRVLMNTNNCDANYYIDYIRPYTSYGALEYIGVNLTVIIVSSKDQK